MDEAFFIPSNWKYWLVSGLVLLLGLLILSISLQSPNVSFADRDLEQNKVLQKIREGLIVPGHPAYIGMMLFDRVSLGIILDQQQRVERYIMYAQRRMEAADILFSINEEKLAITTLSKSNIYLHKAVQTLTASEQLRTDASLLRVVEVELKRHSERMLLLRENLTNARRSEIDAILNHNIAMQTALEGYINRK